MVLHGPLSSSSQDACFGVVGAVADCFEFHRRAAGRKTDIRSDIRVAESSLELMIVLSGPPPCSRDHPRMEHQRAICLGCKVAADRG